MGDVLQEQGGEELFATVERIRSLTKQARESAGSEAAEAELDLLFGGMDFATALPVLKAFTTYFQFVNLAEQKKSRGSIAGGPPKPGTSRGPRSVRDAIRRLREAGVRRRRCAT